MMSLEEECILGHRPRPARKQAGRLCRWVLGGMNNARDGHGLLEILFLDYRLKYLALALVHYEERGAERWYSLQ